MQRILVALENCQLHALVSPQAVEGMEKVLRHGLFSANVWRIVDHFRVTLQAPGSVREQLPTRILTYNAFLVLEVCVVLLHRRVDGLEGRHQVVEDGRTPCLALMLSKPTGIDDAHLLQDCRLSRFTGTCVVSVNFSLAPRAVLHHTKQQELHLALRLLPVQAEVLLDVLILLGLGVHGFPSKTHYARCHVTRKT